MAIFVRKRLAEQGQHACLIPRRALLTFGSKKSSLEVNLRRTQSTLDPSHGSFFGWENFCKDVSINKNGLCFVELRSGTLNFLLGHRALHGMAPSFICDLLRTKCDRRSVQTSGKETSLMLDHHYRIPSLRFEIVIQY